MSQGPWEARWEDCGSACPNPDSSPRCLCAACPSSSSSLAISSPPCGSFTRNSTVSGTGARQTEAGSSAHWPGRAFCTPCVVLGGGTPSSRRSFCSLGSVGSVGPKGYAGEDVDLCPSLWQAGASGLNKGREAQRWHEVCGLLVVLCAATARVLGTPELLSLVSQLSRPRWRPQICLRNIRQIQKTTLFQGPEVI